MINRLRGISTRISSILILNRPGSDGRLCQALPRAQRVLQAENPKGPPHRGTAGRRHSSAAPPPTGVPGGRVGRTVRALQIPRRTAQAGDRPMHRYGTGSLPAVAPKADSAAMWSFEVPGCNLAVSLLITQSAITSCGVNHQEHAEPHVHQIGPHTTWSTTKARDRHSTRALSVEMVALIKPGMSAIDVFPAGLRPSPIPRPNPRIPVGAELSFRPRSTDSGPQCRLMKGPQTHSWVASPDHLV